MKLISIVEAIKQIRHVQKVVGNVANMEEAIAESRIKSELMDKILEILR